MLSTAMATWRDTSVKTGVSSEMCSGELRKEKWIEPRMRLRTSIGKAMVAVRPAATMAPIDDRSL